ncbi:MAG: tetratricopeptide repeat protein [Treponema sp.]|nr:tetratricopeptide repeat protein [Treponema sp.]
MKKHILAVFLLASATTWVFGHTNFTIAQDMFMQNRPREAAAYLEITIAEDPSNVLAFLYLGIVYEQLGMLDEAITVYRQVLDRAGNLTANVANNLGNVFFRRGFIDEAEEMYTRAIQADRTFATAYLGRANIRLQRGMLHEAVADYQQYLIFSPRSPQRAPIEQVINHIRAEFAEAERQRLAAEEAVRLAALEAERQRLAAEEAVRLAAIEAERQRLAAEEAARLAAIEAERQRLIAEEIARLEAERRQRLLDEIAASLQAAAEGSQGIGVGAEGVERFEGEFELE